MQIIRDTTAAEVTDWIINKGFVLCAHPRKGIVVVNGYKRYKADDAACKAVNKAYQIKHSK